MRILCVNRPAFGYTAFSIRAVGATRHLAWVKVEVEVLSAHALGGPAGGSTVSTAMRRAREAAEQRVFDAAQRMWKSGLHANLQDSMFYL